MTNAYCDLLDVKSSVSGDVPNFGSGHDLSLVKKILEVSRDIDRKIAICRGDPETTWSFLADRHFGRQIIYVSATPPATDGSFTLTFGSETTIPILYDADSAQVSDALEALAGIGAGNVSVSGVPGGPWTVDFAGALVGPQATFVGVADLTPDDARITVLPAIVGVVEVPSERRFYPSSMGYGDLIMEIDDCLDVSDVVLYGSDGVTVSRSLAPYVDYYPWPLNRRPTQALKFTSASSGQVEWPRNYGVRARWGYGDEIPTDVREATVIEVVRSHLAGIAGQDDRIGMTPYGSVMTTKAFTSKVKDLMTDYGKKLWP